MSVGCNSEFQTAGRSHSRHRHPEVPAEGGPRRMTACLSPFEARAARSHLSVTCLSILAAGFARGFGLRSPHPNEGDGAPVGATSLFVGTSLPKCRASRRSIAAFWRAPAWHFPPAPDRACVRKRTSLASSQRAPRARLVMAVGRGSGALRVPGLRKAGPAESPPPRSANQTPPEGDPR